MGIPYGRAMSELMAVDVKTPTKKTQTVLETN